MRLSLAIAASAIALTAVTNSGAQPFADISKARDAIILGSSFSDNLARHYRALGVIEADVMVDWLDAEHFAEKALAAEAGDWVMPENPSQWGIDSKDTLNDLQIARAALIDMLRGGGRVMAPQDAARAQVNYDCWVEQAEEGWQKAHIAACRNGFQAALAHATAKIHADVGALMPDRLLGKVYFSLDGTELDQADRQVLSHLAEAIKDPSDWQVTIIGHADTSGPEAYNRELSRKRAITVHDTLVAEGLDVRYLDAMHVGAAGESRPAVITGDETVHPLNRRVTITVTPATDAQS